MTVETGGAADLRRVRPRRRALRWVLATMVVLVIAVLVAAVLMIRDALTARDALQDAAAQVPAVEETLRTGLFEESGRSMTDAPELIALQEQTAIARDATDGVLWDLASYLPVIGPSVDAVQRVAAALDDLAADVLPALAATADAAAATSRTDDGGIDLAPLAAVAGQASAARVTLDEARAELDQVDPTRIRTELVEPLVALDARLDQLAGITATAERVTTLLPPMLGADEPRQYLLLGMNNGELRAAGGIPGALTLMAVEDGRVTIEKQAASGDVGPFEESVVPLDPEEEAAYSERIGRFVQDVTATPEFTTTGAAAAEMWARSQGETVDGVVATDPVALSFLLEVTGPVQVPLPEEVAAAVGSDSVEVGAENVVDLLLRRVYDTLQPEEADQLFAAVAAATFAGITSSDMEVSAVLPAFQRAAAQHRLLTWSADPDEQDLLTGTLIAGTFGAERTADAVGVFLEDTRVGKMSAYLDVELDLARSVCTGDGRLDTVAVTLTNRLDRETARDLPFYVAGPEDDPRRGDVVVNLTAAGPQGGGAPALTQDGAPVGGSSLAVHGRQNTTIGVTLRPGRTTTIEVAVPASAAAARGEGTGVPGRLEVWSTPTASTSGLRELEVPFCG
ncbi:DUF4012 domain-containing protein [Isoptericola sp. S6320L]|uniref:DUF4012 domain-containing protein n=1 Tax=Isoptericola sp. S6320L TaxID=2926411 RepID=UPI001FF69210|nr:DUF4012 domain-containing protein [Isoptericola sp. S6320L]MCK0116406.1 DUF4012 domain-containing protein [Isoptericola sp. S6320L]